MDLIAELRDGAHGDLPDVARRALLGIDARFEAPMVQINDLECELLAWHRQDEISRRLETIPGVGILTATALAANVPDPSAFRSGRRFAAFLSLTPRQNSSVGKDKLGRISKLGNGYLRRLFVVGATSVIRRAATNSFATCAWAVIERGEIYRVPAMALETRTVAARCHRTEAARAE